jgi:hypothetical protein
MFSSLGLARATVAIVAIVAASAACSQSTAGAQPGLNPERRITTQEARALIYALLKGPSHEYSLEPYTPLSPEFYGFEALGQNPGSVGGWMVNPWNAEVWDTYDPCRLVTTPRLKKLQDEIRRRHKFTKEELAKAKKLKPFCDVPE